jgi:ABC-type transport system substrate-binding protein
MVSPGAIRLYGDETDRNPVGTGPFYLDTWDDQRIIMRRFKKYRQADGHISRLIFELYPYSRQLENAFINGELDVVFAVSNFSTDRLKWTGEIDYIANTPISCNMLAFNMKDKELRDIKLRKRILAAIDMKKTIARLYRSTSVAAVNPLPPVFKGYSQLRQSEFNLSQPDRETAHEDTNKITLDFFYPAYSFLRPVFIEALKSELGKAGITLRDRPFSTAEKYYTAVRSDSVQLFLYGWRSEVLGDAGNFLWSLFHSQSYYNFFDYKNTEVDHWLDKSREESGRNKRIEYYRSVVRQVLQDTPAVFLNQLKEFYAYNSKRIKSISMNPYGIINYKDVIIDENQ